MLIFLLTHMSYASYSVPWNLHQPRMPTQGATWATRPEFNVAIIYEDGAAGKRAKHFYDRVIRELVDECDFSLELWNFQLLAIPEIGNSAAKAVAQADFVILSMRCKARLSAETRDWIESWSGLITDNKSALRRAARSTWNKTWHSRIDTGLSTQGGRPEWD
jgi:hypothetical protein